MRFGVQQITPELQTVCSGVKSVMASISCQNSSCRDVKVPALPSLSIEV